MKRRQFLRPEQALWSSRLYWRSLSALAFSIVVIFWIRIFTLWIPSSTPPVPEVETSLAALHADMDFSDYPFSEGPDIHAFISCDELPKPLNMKEVRRVIGYPIPAKEAGIEGTVVLRILVDESGQGIRSQIVKQLHPMLDRACQKYFDELTFSPALQQGNPIPFWVNVPFHFRLK